MPLWIAATSATGLRLAGRIGDGVLLNTVASPNTRRMPCASCARLHGRRGATRRPSGSRGSSTRSSRRTTTPARRRALEVATKLSRQASQAAPRLRVGEPWIDPAEMPRFEAAFAAGGPERLAQAIPPSWIEGLTASGTPDEVVQRVERYREAGVTLPILRPAARHQTPRVIDLSAPR